MRQISTLVCAGAAFAATLVLHAGSTQAFVCIRTQPDGPCLHWTAKATTLRTFLGSPGMPLANGTLSWDQNAINAANDWNLVNADFHFNTVIGGQFVDPCTALGQGVCPRPAGDNPVFFSSTACGFGFGDIVAQTTSCFDQNGGLVSAPVFVNSNSLFNAYDGPLQPPVNDIRRVLVHEFGHVLGLDHPDRNGQQVVALMNSQESDLDRLQADDMDGIRALYPHTTPGSSGCQMARSDRHVGPAQLLLLCVLGVCLRRRHRGRGAARPR